MADVRTLLNGQQVTLIDNGDGTFRIDLNTREARSFIREGELTMLRNRKQKLVEQRSAVIGEIENATIYLNEQRAKREEINAEIDVINANIDELVAWLSVAGDLDNSKGVR